MRYPFSDLDVRAYPTVRDLDNPYIFGNVRVVINVSEHRYPLRMRLKMRRMGLRTYHLPLKEEGCDMGLDNIIAAVKILMDADRCGEKVILHCMCGTNRSRTVAEAFSYAKTGEHFSDGYRGQFNHLKYNSLAGHLPPMDEIEGRLIDSLRQEIDY